MYMYNKIEWNRYRGCRNERQFAQADRNWGWRIEGLGKFHPGYDYKRIFINPYTREPEGEWEYIECKAGLRSRLSPIEKKMQKKYGDRYKIYRNPYM